MQFRWQDMALTGMTCLWLGTWLPSAYHVIQDWRRIEERQREIFCEMAVRTQLLKRCDTDGSAHIPPRPDQGPEKTGRK